MPRHTKTGEVLTDDDLGSRADEFEQTEFAPENVEVVKKTRRRSPRIGDTARS